MRQLQLCQGRQGGQLVVAISASPSSPAEDQRAATCRGGIQSSLSGSGGWWQPWLAAVVDGGGNGLVAGGNKRGAKMNHPWLFWGTSHLMGATLIPNLRTLWHLPWYALCCGIETFADSIVKGMVNVQQWDGEGGRWGMGWKVEAAEILCRPNIWFTETYCIYCYIIMYLINILFVRRYYYNY